MNDIIQNGLVLIVFGVAVAFMFRKFFWKEKKATSSKKGCGSSDCGCS